VLTVSPLWTMSFLMSPISAVTTGRVQAGLEGGDDPVALAVPLTALVNHFP